MAIDKLPPDQYNVVVENEMDRARLLWLANQIEEDKLRKSVVKYYARWPGCQPFVSTILKSHRLTVPVEVYAPKPAPVFWLYLLLLKGSPKVKIGFTGHWPRFRLPAGDTIFSRANRPAGSALSLDQASRCPAPS